MYRLAILLVVLAALAAVGCGGSDDSDSAPSAVAQAQDSASPSDDADESGSTETQKADDAAKKPSDAQKEDEEASEPTTPAEAEQAQEEAIAAVPLKHKTKLFETVARSVLLSVGVTLVDGEVRDGGRKGTAAVATKGACNFVANQEASLAGSIKQGVPGLKSVRFEVADTGEELAYYVLRCDKPDIPSGAGRVVLDHSGVGGPYKSKRFKITTERWALEWVNESASLAAVIVPVAGESRKEERSFDPVGSKKPESGRNEYKGRGTFQIQAYGAGGWRFRVKEIG